MAPGIQHIQAAQLFKLPSSSIGGVPELRNKKWLNSNLTCGTSIWGGSQSIRVETGFVNDQAGFSRKEVFYEKKNG